MNLYIKCLKKALEDDIVLKNIRNKKYKLLSEYQRYLLNCYLKFKDIKFKKTFIKSFIYNLSKFEQDRLDFYINQLRDIIEFDINIGKIKNIDFSMPLNTVLKDKPIGFSNDFYFNQLIEKENYDELYNLYGLDEISKKSNILKR